MRFWGWLIIFNYHTTWNMKLETWLYSFLCFRFYASSFRLISLFVFPSYPISLLPQFFQKSLSLFFVRGFSVPEIISFNFFDTFSRNRVRNDNRGLLNDCFRLLHRINDLAMRQMERVIRKTCPEQGRPNRQWPSIEMKNLIFFPDRNLPLALEKFPSSLSGQEWQ